MQRGEVDMALIKCPECGKEISESAKICPNCAYDINAYFRRKKEAERVQKIEEERVQRLEARREYISYIKERLFGSKRKRMAWGLSISACLIMIIVFFAYNSDLNSCKTNAKKTYEYYEEVHGNIMSYQDYGDRRWYDVSATTMSVYNSAYNRTMEDYDKLSESKQRNFENWFKNKYGMSFDTFKTNCKSDNMGQDFLYDWESYLSNRRSSTFRAQQEAKDKEVEIVSKDLKLSGNYWDFTATLKNNTSYTITYVKYTIFLYDKDGNNIDTDWSNWTGSFKPGATINVDTMIKYSSDADKFSVVIDDYDIE